MFSRDEMQRAIEDALKSMEGIALELYRRGREPLLAELEDCRARKADLCTMLERVATERDKAEAELRDLQRRTSEALAQAVEWQRERDEARAEVERLREMAHDFEAMREDRDEARAERDAAIARITEVGVMVATNGNALAKEAYRRGAEAMREACAREASVCANHRGEELADILSAMPAPEDP